MILDIILIALFLVAIVWGAHKGGVKIIAGLASFILAFVLAYTLADNVANYIQGTSIGIKIEDAIESRIINNEEQGLEDSEQNNGLIEEIQEKDETQTDAITKIEEALGNKVNDVVNDGKELVGEKVVGAVFYGIGFLTTFIGVKIVLFIVFLIIGVIFKLPILKTFNKLIGCILEVVLMLFKVWIVLGLISFIAPLDFMQSVIELINQTVITKLLYEHNIIVSLIIGKTI